MFTLAEFMLSYHSIFVPPYILKSPMMPCSLDTLPLPTVSDFADLAEPFYSAIKQDVLEDSSSDLLEQVDIGDRNFFDQPQR